MSVMSALHSEHHELHDLDQPQPEPSRTEVVAEELRALERWRYQALQATYSGTCYVCRGPIEPGQPVYHVRAGGGPRRTWHLSCHPAPVQNLHSPISTDPIIFSSKSVGTPAIAAPALPLTLPAAETTAASARLVPERSIGGDHLRGGRCVFSYSGEGMAPAPFLLPITVQVGAGGRRWTDATLTVEVPSYEH